MRGTMTRRPVITPDPFAIVLALLERELAKAHLDLNGT
jgi:hypothetical protein